MSENYIAYTFAFGGYMPYAERSIKSMVKFHQKMLIYLFTPDVEIAKSWNIKNLVIERTDSTDISKECIYAGIKLQKLCPNIIYFDADSLTVSRFHEVFKQDKPALMLSLAIRHGRIVTVDKTISPDKVPNRGFFAVYGIPNFFEQYKNVWLKRLPIDAEWADNDALSIMQKVVPTVFLEVENNVYYNETGRDYWKKTGGVKLVDGELICENGKKLRFMHWAAGWLKPGKEFLKNDHKLSEDIVKFLEYL